MTITRSITTVLARRNPKTSWFTRTRRTFSGSTVSTTEDERFAILSIEDLGKGKKGNAILVRDATKKDTHWSPVIPEVTDDEFSVIDDIGDSLLIRTNKDAPNWKVVLVDPKNPAEANWKTILPEKPEPLDQATTA